MAPRGMKRTAAKQPTEEPAAKRITAFLKQQGVTKASYEPVLEVVQHPLSGLSESVRSMVLAVLPWSLAVPSDQRHAAQHAVVRMVDEVVETVHAELQRVAKAAADKVDELEASRADLDAGVLQSQAAHAEAERSVNESKGQLAAAGAEVPKCREALRGAVTVEVDRESELQQALSLKSQLEDVLSGSLKQLVDGDYEDDGANGLIQVVTAAGAKSGLEESLMATLPLSLAKRERGGFDDVVISEAEKAIGGQIAALHEVAESAAATHAEQASAVQAAQTFLEAAERDLKLAAEGLRGAQEADSLAAASVEVAKVKAADQENTLAQAIGVRDAKQQELNQFRDYNMCIFTLMRDSISDKERSESIMEHHGDEERQERIDA